MTRSSLLLAAAVAVVAFGVLVATERRIGLTWDEPDYLAASESYVGWYGELLRRPARALSDEGIREHWTLNHEHVPLAKVWTGLGWAATRGVVADLTAHRMGSMLLAGCLFALLYLLVSDAWGRGAGLAACVALMAMPRFFFHAHLAALDVPVLAPVLATLLVFWKTRTDPARRVDVVLGVLFGLAVASRATAVLLFPSLALWTLIFERRRRIAVRLAVMGAVALVVFFLAWPWLYHDTLDRLLAYVRFLTVEHWPIGQWYAHRFTRPPPWHFPFVMTAVVVPVGILALSLVGATRAFVPGERRGLAALLLLNALVPLVVLAAGRSSIYDNDRQFLPVMPFIAALAAVGLVSVLRLLEGRLRAPSRAVVGAALAAGVVVPPVVSAAALYPHLLSYYSGLVGGVSGARRLGFETTYWCETYGAVLDHLDENAAPGDVVWVAPGSYNVMIYYQLHGRLRDDVSIANTVVIPSLLDPTISTVRVPFSRADFVVFQHRQTTFGPAGYDSRLARWIARRTPSFQVVHDGVPLISVFRGDQRPAPASGRLRQKTPTPVGR